MPFFSAPLSGSSNLLGDLYVLDIQDPQAADNLIGAYIVEDIGASHIAEELARKFGASQEGDEIEVSIRQWNTTTGKIHVFDPIPIIVKYANRRAGPNYFQFGMYDIERFFDVYLVLPSVTHPSPQHLFLDPLPHYKHWCRKR